MKILLIICCATVLMLLGCSGLKSNVLGPFILKTYNVVTKLEVVANEINVNNIAYNTEKIKGPVEVINKVLLFIAERVSGKAKKNIENISIYIQIILDVLKEINVDNIDKEKAKLIGSISELKLAVKQVADYVGVELPVVTLSTGSDNLIDLEIATAELEALLKENN